jgi:hypothetical protein
VERATCCVCQVPLRTGAIRVWFTRTWTEGWCEIYHHVGDARRGGRLRSPHDLLPVLEAEGMTALELARADARLFAVLVIYLAELDHHVIPPEMLWDEIEKHLPLRRQDNRPRLEGDTTFVFLTYSGCNPVLKLNEVTVDLPTMDVSLRPIVHLCWRI